MHPGFVGRAEVERKDFLGRRFSKNAISGLDQAGPDLGFDRPGRFIGGWQGSSPWANCTRTALGMESRNPGPRDGWAQAMGVRKNDSLRERTRRRLN
jgi:hypothetical protein